MTREADLSPGPAGDERADVTPAGFFVLRTPLLAFDELIGWSEGIAARDAAEDAERLPKAFEADCALLRARLKAIATRPEVREALFLASPTLDDSIGLWLRAPESERGQEVERALVRYFQRMAGRATPFGLFAGCSVGTVDRETRLVIGAGAQSRRSSRLDANYLCALTDALARDPALRGAFSHHPNSSLYRAGGSFRCVETRLDGTLRSHHLVAIEPTEALEATLARARNGATLAALAAELAGGDVSLAEADRYVAELVENQVLVSDMTVPLTGPEPVRSVVEMLRSHAQTRPSADRLDEARHALEAMDAAGLGIAPERYRAVAQGLDGLPAKAELPQLFQVDLVKAAAGATLGTAVLDDLVESIDLLRRLTRPHRNETLRRFREAFVARYERREIPLVEALDEEMGVGFEAGADAAPVMRDLALSPAANETAPWGERERVLLRKLAETLMTHGEEIVLAPQDVEALAAKNPPPLPDTFAVLASIAAQSEAAVARGDFRLHIHITMGPSGARLLGRFCHADPALRSHVEALLRAEEARDPHAIFAEIVHLPEGRLGNILFRPMLRDHEIPFLGRGGAPPERQIPITDLMVSVVGDQILLRSARLRRRVIPRLTTAHNFLGGSLGVYHFLCALQSQGVAGGLGWDWGPLVATSFLPRVVAGRIVLARARWRAGKEELRRLGARAGAARFQAVQAWRVARRLPRWVALVDDDQALPIDLDNALAVESFVHLVKGRDEMTLTELFPPPDQLCARGPEGRFVHEVIVPFIRGAKVGERAAAETAACASPALCLAPALQVRRSFPPGSEWLYVKLYTGSATADQVLRTAVAPIVRKALRARTADRWFFIRYADPDWHLRLRIHGEPTALERRVWPSLRQALAPLLDDGRVWRVVLDTYEQEVERYGGADGIELAEQIFHADSEAALEAVELLEAGDAGLEERWRLALRGMAQLLDDLGFDDAARAALLRDARDGLARELRADDTLGKQLSRRWQKERAGLPGFLDSIGDSESPLAPGIEVLCARSERLRPIVAELRAREAGRRLTVPLRDLAWSFLHMHANRLLRSAHQEQELVLYDLLARHYEAKLCRAGAAGTRKGSFRRHEGKGSAAHRLALSFPLGREAPR